MADCMEFPKTVDEFMEQYKITDTEQIYTNGMDMVPVFRMKQWFETHPQTGHWIQGHSGNLVTLKCDRCNYTDVYKEKPIWIPNYCANCGVYMKGEISESNL